MWIVAAITVAVVVVAYLADPGAEAPARRACRSGVERDERADVPPGPQRAGGEGRGLAGSSSARGAFTLIPPDGSVATTSPGGLGPPGDPAANGFVRGELLGVATEAWAPPEDERWITAEALAQDVRSIRRFADGGGVPCYWFEAPPELVAEVGRYLDETPREAGAGVAAPLRAKARRGVRSGFIGLVVGVLVLAFGIASPARPPGRPGESDPRVRTIVLGAMISLVGLVRLVQGLRAQGEARRLG